MSMTHPEPLRVRAVQCSIAWNDVATNLEYIERIVQTHATGADLIIFPETITTGFSSEAALLADAQQGEVYHFLLEVACGMEDLEDT